MTIRQAVPVADYPDDLQYESDLVAWISEDYPDQIPELIECGALKLPGADAVEVLGAG